MHKHLHEYRHKRDHSLLVPRRPSTVKYANNFLEAPVATVEASKFGVRVASGPARGRQHMPRDSYRIFKVRGWHVKGYGPLPKFRLVSGS